MNTVRQRLVERWVDVSLRLSQLRANPAQAPKRAGPNARERRENKETAG